MPANVQIWTRPAAGDALGAAGRVQEERQHTVQDDSQVNGAMRLDGSDLGRIEAFHDRNDAAVSAASHFQSDGGFLK